ncbi:MAG: hypothetical protein PHD67_10740 [Oscillospiraceae bacterium]|nr:hypothetical protein [Oscillospiraceae bacterium]
MLFILFILSPILSFWLTSPGLFFWACSPIKRHNKKAFYRLAQDVRFTPRREIAGSPPFSFFLHRFRTFSPAASPPYN